MRIEEYRSAARKLGEFILWSRRERFKVVPEDFKTWYEYAALCYNDRISRYVPIIDPVKEVQHVPYTSDSMHQEPINVIGWIDEMGNFKVKPDKWGKL